MEKKIHKCTIGDCDKNFKTKNKLNRHLAYVHNINVKWHSCDQIGCNKNLNLIVI